MIAHTRREAKLHPFLTSVKDGGGWSASGPDCFTLAEKAHSTR